MTRPNILFIMTDQQRFDAIGALGDLRLHTPNMDRLVARGVTFTRAYSPCPVCVPARCTIRTGRLPPTTRIFSNISSGPVAGQADTIEGRCGPYLARLMRQRGYRTFGIGKFHTHPWNEDLGYELHRHTEEMYGSLTQRDADLYAGLIHREHPAFAHIEQLMGERTEMYYMPQTSPFPPELNVEYVAAKEAVQQINPSGDGRPFFGFVSFVGPHPPLAPPVPFNRLYDPDRMPAPIVGDLAVDHLDEQIPWMNHLIWADGVDPLRAACCKARYYGELTYIDWCLGMILDAVEARGDADNTVICFFSDHGEHLGDHHAWQKESFFESSTRIPFLLSWPARLPRNVKRHEFVGLEDLVAIATGAAGEVEVRDGIDVLGVLEGKVQQRDHYVGFYGEPGTRLFKVMVRRGDWKYIYLANGAREQLFKLADDPHELRQRAGSDDAIRRELRALAVVACRHPGAADALDGADFRGLDFQARPRHRINQMNRLCGAKGFPEHPRDVLDAWEASRHAAVDRAPSGG